MLLQLSLRSTSAGVRLRAAASSERAKSMTYEKFLGRFLTENPTAPQMSSTDPAEIAEFIVKHAPSDTVRRWLAELIELSSPSTAGLGFGTLALLVGGLLAGAGLIYGIFIKPDFLASLATADQARGLVTFLFAFATIAVVLISVIATFWVPSGEVATRGAAAKDILTILIGIMGTILGFYFGSADRAPVSVPVEVNETATQ